MTNSFKKIPTFLQNNDIDKDVALILEASLSEKPQSKGVVLAFCAQWCGTCRGFNTDFLEQAKANPDWIFRWIDVEDEADLMGDFDVETFPTVYIASSQGELKFGGAMLPHAAQITRFINS